MAYTLANLQDDIRNYTEVDDSVLSNTLLSTIIKNAENKIYRDADSDDNRFYATSNLVSGNRYVTIPSDLRFIRYVQLTDSNNKQTFLEKRDTSFISEFAPNDSTTGTPKYYANWEDNVQTGNIILVAPTPSSALTVQVNYIKDPPNFTSSNNTYISQHQESMLLHGVLSEAFRFLKGPMDMYNLYEKKYNEEVQNFALQQMGRRRRAEYDDGVPRVVIPSPSPNKN